MARSFTFASFLILVSSACASHTTTASAPASPAEPPAATAEPAAEESAVEWWTSKTPCPDGAALTGTAPPAGSEVSCVLGSVPHGPKTTFHKGGQRALS